jgi:Xaa-Pro dipeptidase
MMDLQTIQDFLRLRQIDAWLLYDFRGSNAVLWQLMPGSRWTTRRVMLVIPAHASPVLFVHNIDAPQFHDCGLAVRVYDTWPQYHQYLREATAGLERVAMEYSPQNALPAVSMVDAGTVEFIRSIGPAVVSSEDLIQISVARWSERSLQMHYKCAELTAQVKDEAFDLIRERHRARQVVTERDVEQFILKRFHELGLDPDHPPIVGCNAHSGDPHFEVSPTDPAPINPGDWLLLDLWSRYPGQEHIFADITWMAYCGERVPEFHQRVWTAVKAARDAALAKVVDAWKAKTPVQGYELDDAARAAIEAHGFTHAIRHRTGHSLSPGPKIHGFGANLDNFESHDTRQILPGTGFTIEPALYVPEGFGCRSEINLYIDETRGPVVTGPVQDEVVLIGPF